MSYKDKVIDMLYENGASDITCEKRYDRIAQEKLYLVIYFKDRKLKTLAKALHPSKAWRRAYEKLKEK